MDQTRHDVYVVDCCRTPIGRHRGALSGIRPDDLAAAVLGALLARNATLDPAEISDVVWGAANQAGEDNRNVARMAVLLAGLPLTVPGATVNRLCGSGLDALNRAAADLALGHGDVSVAGGVGGDEPGAVRPAAGDRPPAADAGARRLGARLAARQPADARRAHDQPRHDRRGARRRVLDQPRGPGPLRRRAATRRRWRRRRPGCSTAS